jgi:uncharacterized membrane protein
MWSSASCASAGLTGWLLMVGLWVGMLVVVGWGINRIFPAANRRSRTEVLIAHRLATGEIDPQTYRQLHDELSGSDQR